MLFIDIETVEELELPLNSHFALNTVFRDSEWNRLAWTLWFKKLFKA